MARSVLFVDKDPRIQTVLDAAMAVEGGEARTARDAGRAIDLLADHAADVVVADVRTMSDGRDGLLDHLREHAPETLVVLTAPLEDMSRLGPLIRDGAVDFLLKPIDEARLAAALGRVFEDREARRRRSGLRPPPPATGASYRLVGRDEKMLEIHRMIGSVAASRATVLVRGEAGSGKELIARAIHRSSPFANEPFVAVRCADFQESELLAEVFGCAETMPDGRHGEHHGRIALAGRGTVYLEEIGDTSLPFQATLLKVLRDRLYLPVSATRSERLQARIITSTKRDLERLVSQGLFREDLYQYLRVVEIQVPPLRERAADIPLLAEALLDGLSRASGRRKPPISDHAMTLFRSHSWPGNVRELKNRLSRALDLSAGSTIRPEHIDLQELDRDEDLMVALRVLERQQIERALVESAGQSRLAAELLGTTRRALDHLIEKHGLDDSVNARTRHTGTVAR